MKTALYRMTASLLVVLLAFEPLMAAGRPPLLPCAAPLPALATSIQPIFAAEACEFPMIWVSKAAGVAFGLRRLAGRLPLPRGWRWIAPTTALVQETSGHGQSPFPGPYVASLLRLQQALEPLLTGLEPRLNTWERATDRQLKRKLERQLQDALEGWRSTTGRAYIALSPAVKDPGVMSSFRLVNRWFSSMNVSLPMTLNLLNSLQEAIQIGQAYEEATKQPIRLVMDELKAKSLRMEPSPPPVARKTPVLVQRGRLPTSSSQTVESASVKSPSLHVGSHVIYGDEVADVTRLNDKPQTAIILRWDHTLKTVPMNALQTVLSREQAQRLAESLPREKTLKQLRFIIGMLGFDLVPPGNLPLVGEALRKWSGAGLDEIIWNRIVRLGRNLEQREKPDRDVVIYLMRWLVHRAERSSGFDKTRLGVLFVIGLNVGYLTWQILGARMHPGGGHLLAMAVGGTHLGWFSGLATAIAVGFMWLGRGEIPHRDQPFTAAQRVALREIIEEELQADPMILSRDDAGFQQFDVGWNGKPGVLAQDNVKILLVDKLSQRAHSRTAESEPIDGLVYFPLVLASPQGSQKIVAIDASQTHLVTDASENVLRAWGRYVVTALRHPGESGEELQFRAPIGAENLPFLDEEYQERLFYAVRNAVANGYSDDDILNITGLSETEVLQLSAGENPLTRDGSQKVLLALENLTPESRSEQPSWLAWQKEVKEVLAGTIDYFERLGFQATPAGSGDSPGLMATRGDEIWTVTLRPNQVEIGYQEREASWSAIFSDSQDLLIMEGGPYQVQLPHMQFSGFSSEDGRILLAVSDAYIDWLRRTVDVRAANLNRYERAAIQSYSDRLVSADEEGTLQTAARLDLRSGKADPEDAVLDAEFAFLNFLASRGEAFLGQIEPHVRFHEIAITGNPRWQDPRIVKKTLILPLNWLPQSRAQYEEKERALINIANKNGERSAKEEGNGLRKNTLMSILVPLTFAGYAVWQFWHGGPATHSNIFESATMTFLPANPFQAIALFLAVFVAKVFHESARSMHPTVGLTRSA